MQKNDVLRAQKNAVPIPAYDICRLIMLGAYEFVALLCLSLMTFVALLCSSHMTFVQYGIYVHLMSRLTALLSLSPTALLAIQVQSPLRSTSTPCTTRVWLPTNSPPDWFIVKNLPCTVQNIIIITIIEHILLIVNKKDYK